MKEELKKDEELSKLLLIYGLMLPFEEALASSFGSILKIIAIVIIIYVLLKYKKYMVKINKAIYPICLWIIYMAVSIIWSNSFEYWSYFFKIYLVQIIFLVLLNSVPAGVIDLKKMRVGIILGSIISALLLILMPKASLLTEEGRRTIIIFGHMFDPNIVASIMMLGIFMLLYEYFRKNTKNINLYFIASFLIIMLGILFTGSRGALISTCFSLVICIFLKLKDNGNRKKSFKLLIFGIIGILFAFMVLPENLLSTRFSKTTILGLNELENGAHNRYTIWEYSARLIKNKPIIGYGCGNFFSAIASVYKTSAAHNLFILLIVEGGIIGLLIFISFLLSVIKKIYNNKDYVTVSMLLGIFIMALTLDTITYKYFWIAIIYALIIEKESGVYDKNKNNN